MTRISFIFLLLATSCVRDRVKDSVSEPKSIDSVKNKLDTTKLQALAEPPPALTFSTKAQKDFSVKTDSSTIKTEFYPGGKEVRETINDKDLVYYKFFRDNGSVATSTVTYDKSGRRIGIAKEYTDNGKLLYTIDHDKGTWTVVGKASYPFYDLQAKMRKRADSLIIEMYGKRFLENHAIWSVDGSYIYNENESGNWTDKLRQKPNKFLFRYDVKFDKKHGYDDLIEFELDAKGKIHS